MLLKLDDTSLSAVLRRVRSRMLDLQQQQQRNHFSEQDSASGRFQGSCGRSTPMYCAASLYLFCLTPQ
jgi:hypothetical protein